MNMKTCRNCEREICESENYKSSFYGGYVCDDICERATVNRMHQSQDDHSDPSGFYRGSINDPFR